MRRVSFVLVGLVAGFFAGLILSEVIGVLGVLLLHRAIGFKALPVVTAVVGAATAVTLTHTRARRPPS